MKYRKKPVVVEAYKTDKEIVIHTLEGNMKASIGDYIITGVNGEQYPCKPDIFEKTYESVTNTDYDRINALNKSYFLAKAKAYKEFAERLKEKSDSRFDCSELVFEISEGDIDNLVKEITEVKK